MKHARQTAAACPASVRRDVDRMMLCIKTMVTTVVVMFVTVAVLFAYGSFAKADTGGAVASDYGMKASDVIIPEAEPVLDMDVGNLMDSFVEYVPPVVEEETYYEEEYYDYYDYGYDYYDYSYDYSYDYYDYDTSDGISASEFQWLGVVEDGDTRYTWYSENVLPGGGLTELNENGRHSEGGFVKDADGYIAVASSDYEKGTVLDTPFGAAKVYDTGCASGTVDVYVSF